MLAPLLSSMVLAVNFLLRGGNYVWVSTNVRSLGCRSPFDVPFDAMSYTNPPLTVGFSSCFICASTDFVLLRGAQCICIESRHVPSLVTVSDSYCDIRCTDGSSQSNDETFLCGGNLGANLYCNKLGDACLSASSNETAVDIYREFITDRDDFQSMEPCLTFGCGSKPEFLNPENLPRYEYFPNLNPEDCIVYCTYVSTSYAHAGWLSQETGDGLSYMFPTCACSNVTQPAHPDGPPCSNGTCPSLLYPIDVNQSETNYETSSCGNKNSDHDNWSVFCTTTLLNAEGDGKPYCAPYQTTPPSDGLWETCQSPLQSTQRISSSGATPQPTETLCPSRHKSRNSLREGMKFECSDDCDDSSCCRCGSCGNSTSCSYNGFCYDINSDSSNYEFEDVDALRDVLANKCKNEHPSGGHLLAIETKEEQDFIVKILGFASDEKFSPLTSGMKIGDDSFWEISNDDKIPTPDVSDWEVQLLSTEECSENYPCYLLLKFETQGAGYSTWHFTRCFDSYYFICEYNEPVTTVSTAATVTYTTSTSTETTTHTTTLQPTTIFMEPESTPENNCSCIETDIYHVRWIIEANTTKLQPCRLGAIGNASWACDLTTNKQCRLRTPQPDFSECQSLELVKIGEDVQSADDDTDFYAVWDALYSFTSPGDMYFGHEIDNILDLVVNLMDRQDWQMNGTENHLEFQVNTTQTGARIIDNLISHDAQWDQIESQDDRSEKAIFLLNTTENMSFRLTDIAQLEDRSLRCEIHLANLTLSSAYWNGNQTQIDNCEFNSNDAKQSIWEDVQQIATSDTFRRFPRQQSNTADGSYLLLPEGVIDANYTHKAAGVLISHYILQLLLPGENNVAGNQKKINSPLVSYTIRNYISNDLSLTSVHIPDGSFVEVIYKHGQLAKDPPVKTLHRSMNPGETPSAVIGSSFCTFLSFNRSSHVMYESTWIWEDRGCFLKSTNRTHTVCFCNHLTGFATLMDFHDYTGESRPLEITSITCSLVSTISLAITFIVLTILRSIKTDRTIITQNLCIFLMFSHIMALTTLNRHYLNLDEVTCAVMGILLHFTLLVSFMWMGIEGLRLCRMVLYVFNLKDWTVYYVLTAYIVPFLIVSITVLTAHSKADIMSAYVGDEICWLNGENYKWSFAGPVAVIISVNLVFAMIAVRSSWNLKQNTDRSLEEKIKNAAALLLSLTCLLGISWLMGFFLYTETLVFAYIFTLTNGLQGVTIMLFRCFLNDEVRTAIKDRWKRHRNNRVGRWSSMTTQNTSSQRRQSAVIHENGKRRANMKLSQTNSQSSITSGTTKVTNSAVFIPSRVGLSERHNHNIRSFSGTEFPDELSLDVSGSFSSASSVALHHHDGNRKPSITHDGVRDSRRVSFLFNQKLSPLSPFPTGIPEHVTVNDSTETSLVSRRPVNSLFYNQDPSAFF